MEHSELKLGVKLALNKLLELIERGDFKHLKKLYADGTIPENNLKYLIKDAKSLRKNELASLCEAVKSDGSVKVGKLALLFILMIGKILILGYFLPKLP